MFLQWSLVYTNPVFSAITENKRLVVRTLNSVLKYMGEFGVEDLHANEVVSFVGEHTERREPTHVLIQPGNLTTPQKYMMVPKDDT